MASQSTLLRDAPTVWKLLKGVVCVYKPSGVSEAGVKYALITKLCKDLNELECRPPVDHVSIVGHTQHPTVIVNPSYADDPLVVGPRYQKQDFLCKWVLPLGIHTSGVFLMGLNDGVKVSGALEVAHQVRTFHVRGTLGRATDTFYMDGRVTERSKFQHVTQPKLDKCLATIQAAHQKSMFELSALDIRSQDAYEMAVQGLVRPADPNVPMIYGIRCIHFNPPDFTIEIHSTNEYEFYLKSLINEIGIKMHSNAVCSGLRCVRHSYFSLQNALLRKHWTLQHVINNLQDSQRILRDNPQIYSGTLTDYRQLERQPEVLPA